MASFFNSISLICFFICLLHVIFGRLCSHSNHFKVSRFPEFIITIHLQSMTIPSRSICFCLSFQSFQTQQIHKFSVAPFLNIPSHVAFFSSSQNCLLIFAQTPSLTSAQHRRPCTTMIGPLFYFQGKLFFHEVISHILKILSI